MTPFEESMTLDRHGRPVPDGAAGDQGLHCGYHIRRFCRFGARLSRQDSSGLEIALGPHCLMRHKWGTRPFCGFLESGLFHKRLILFGPCGDRTHDLRVKSPLLCQLS